MQPSDNINGDGQRRNGLSPEAELHFTRGLLHLRRGEAVMPYAMTIPEEKTLPGADVVLAAVSLATVAASRMLGQTQWIERYRAEMRQALDHFDRVSDLAPEFPPNWYRRAQALRYLGKTEEALASARRAASLAPNDKEISAFVRVLDGGAARKTLQLTTQERERVLTWDDVILPAKTKRELRQMQLILENPAQARALGVEPPSGLLLYGPPGSGKTTVARVLAAQAKCQFFAASPADINQMWMGESEKSVARLFAEARAAAPSILFLDEIDALMPYRTGGVNTLSDKVVNQFLHEMDGLKPNEGVFVVGATNRPDMLDPALVRGGRLSRHIEIPLPDEAARLAILRLNTKMAQIDSSVSLEELARETEGFSGADLKALVTEAGLQALIRIADHGGMQALMREDFDVAVENLRRE
jgi:transitional endoplasmic reticulum ATPase